MSSRQETMWIGAVALIFVLAVLALSAMLTSNDEVDEEQREKAQTVVYETGADYGWVDSSAAVR